MYSNNKLFLSGLNSFICGMTCGYVCPLCEGKTILEDGSDCDYCTQNRVEREEEENEG
jgi:hypothetical protein